MDVRIIIPENSWKIFFLNIYNLKCNGFSPNWFFIFIYFIYFFFEFGHFAQQRSHEPSRYVRNKKMAVHGGKQCCNVFYVHVYVMYVINQNKINKTTKFY